MAVAPRPLPGSTMASSDTIRIGNDTDTNAANRRRPTLGRAGDEGGDDVVDVPIQAHTSSVSVRTMY